MSDEEDEVTDLRRVAKDLREMAEKESDPDDKAKWYKLYLDAVALVRKDSKSKRGKGFSFGQ